MARSKTSRHRPLKRPKIATLFCAEGLRASACLVLDALAVRGWSAQLQTGDAAREALKRFRDPHAGLRVLCLSEPLDRTSTQALRKALDPLGRGDLLIVDFFTPRTVVESILRFSGYRVGARRARPRRTTRSYLAHATLVENTVDVGYWSRYGMGAAAAGVAILSGMSTFWAMSDDSVAPEPTPAAAVAEQHSEPSPLVDRTAYSATAVPMFEPPPAPPRPAPVSRANAPLPGEPRATLEEVDLPEVPLEGIVAVETRRAVPAGLTKGGAPGLAPTRAASLGRRGQ